MEPVKLSIPESVWDKRTLRNNGNYLVEGKAGLGVILGESEERVRKVIGRPTRRSYGEIDALYYYRRTYTGVIFLRKGFVSRVRLYVKHGSEESLMWRTALSLSQRTIEKLSKEKANEFILLFYKDRPFLKSENTLNIHSMGILFHWGKINTGLIKPGEIGTDKKNIGNSKIEEPVSSETKAGQTNSSQVNQEKNQSIESLQYIEIFKPWRADR